MICIIKNYLSITFDKLYNNILIFKENIDIYYLIKFNNRLYDLKNKVLRTKEPKDYIGESVSYDFKEYS